MGNECCSKNKEADLPLPEKLPPNIEDDETAGPVKK